MSRSLRTRLEAARASGDPDASVRARGGLLAWLTQAATGEDAVARLADGTAAAGIGHVALSGAPAPQGLACRSGCAFCCILSGEDGGLITEAEARRLHAALGSATGKPDGRNWHPKACPALDPETRTCRAYEARPMICRSYVSTDATACEKVAEGQAAAGPGTVGPYHTYLAAIGLARAALKGVRRVPTFALSRVAAAAVDGKDIDTALGQARHKPAELDAELRRSRRDTQRRR